MKVIINVVCKILSDGRECTDLTEIFEQEGYEVKIPWGELITSHHQVICIPRTNSENEMTEIYAASDVYVNPTYEDNFAAFIPKAISCGTFVVTHLMGESRKAYQ